MKSKYILMSLALSAAPSAALALGNDIHIKQVPANAEMNETNKEAKIKVDVSSRNYDYQQEVLNNPETNEHARTSQLNQDNESRGNVATIIQHGKSNKSTIVQRGKKNTATQTQTGNHNDIHLNQTGDENHSEEKQSGNYNHKVIIQNGKKTEEIKTNTQEDE